MNKILNRMKYDTETEVCLHGFRGMARGALEESRLFSHEAMERQMSHKTTKNEAEWAYVHHVDHIEERKIIMDWWSDYLDLNHGQYVSPQEFREALLQDARNGVQSFKFGKLISLQMATMKAG